jgi:capsular polysaccharide biosynthesis protein
MRTFIKKILFRRVRLKIVFYLKKGNSFSRIIANIFSKQKFQAFKFENIHNYILSRPQKVQYLYNKSKSLFYGVPQFINIKTEKSDLKEVSGPYNYAAIFEQAAVIGGSNLILLENDKALYDIKDNDTRKNILFGDQGMRYYDDAYCLVAINDSKITYDAAIFLGGNFSWNFYHYLYEILVKFEQIEKIDIDISVPFLVDKINIKVPQYFELLSLFNSKGREIIPIDKGVKYSVEKLYYFSCPNFIPPDFINVKDIQPQDLLFDLKTLEYLRQQLIPRSSKKEFPKRIYISRKKASGRRQFNEDEVFSVLAKYNFEAVFPEDFSIADQIALFHNAEFIVGGSGAAFTNILFCQEKCKALIFIKNPFNFSGFSTIAKFAGVDLIYYTEGLNLNDDINNLHEAYAINAVRLNTYILEWVSGK